MATTGFCINNSMPELVEVKAGEEDEEELLKHWAKVYHYCSDTKQWKEIGVG